MPCLLSNLSGILLRYVGKFQFFLCIFAEKIKNDTGEIKKGKKFFVKKKIDEGNFI